MNQEYTITDLEFTYQIPAFVIDPPFCDIVYSIEVSEPAGQSAFTFDADQYSRTFTFHNDADLSLAGASSQLYMVKVKA